MDLTTVLRQGQDVTTRAGASIFDARNGEMCLGDKSCLLAQSEVMRFAGPNSHLPYWLIGVYLVSNVTLNALNWYWFGKMIETVKKRFEGKPDDEVKTEKEVAVERRKSVVEHAADTLDREVMTGPRTPAVEKSEPFAMSSGIDGVTQVNQRRKGL